MERKLAVIVDNSKRVTTGDENGKMCSSVCDGAEILYSSERHDTLRMHSEVGK